MKTSDVEKETGISKQTILYYEKEGLIHPKKHDNGYRDYTDEDIQRLLLIKFLRSLDITIDDIRLILNQQLSFQECLQIQKPYIQNSAKKYEDIIEHIDFFHDKDLPSLPKLQTVLEDNQKTFLGYQKTTPYVSIGRRPTSRFLKKKMSVSLLWSIILGMGLSIGYFKITHHQPMMIFILSTLFFLIIFIICFGLGIGKMTLFTNTENLSDFIEFHEKGVLYHTHHHFYSQMIYAWHILQNKEQYQYCPYENIDSVKIIHREKYMKAPGTNLSTPCQTIDYEFHIDNGDVLYFINPLVLENDRQLLNMILQAKINHLIEV